jgi:tight adherence protein C
MPATVDKLDQTFPRARESLPWRGEEFLAVAMLEGSCVGALVYLMVGLFLDLWILGFLPAIAAVSLFTLLRVNALLSLAEIRRISFRSRLPFAVDLLALMLEAGASLLQALQTIANEARGHPLGEELQTTLRLIDTGRPLRDALEDLLTRVDDPDLQELLQAIIHGDEMGAPMARVLSIQSEQMRLKRSQWGEKVAGEAQAQIIYPGLVIMVACIFIIAAPFVAQFLSNFN